jgi:integrase
MFTCLNGSRTSEALGLRWEEINFDVRLWTCPAVRMKGGEDHRVPLTKEMLAIIEPLKAMRSDYVFEGQKRHKPLSNTSMLLRRMEVDRRGADVQDAGPERALQPFRRPG